MVTIVFGVEKFGVGQRDVADLALALDLGLAEIDKAAAAKFGEAIQRLTLGLEHRVDEMHTAALVGEDLREEQALIDLVAFLGALLHQRALLLEHARASAAAPDSGAAAATTSSETRKKARAAAGHLVVDRDGMEPEEPLLDRARALALSASASVRRSPHALALSGPMARSAASISADVGAGGLGVARERGAEGRFG